MAKNAWTRPAGADGYVPIVMLRQRLAAMYGSRWSALFADEAAVIAWQDEAAGFLYAQGVKWVWMRSALDRLRSNLKADSMPPSLGELAAMCRPEADYKSAFIEAQRKAHAPDALAADWSSAAVYWAAFDFGLSSIRSASFRGVSKVRWIECLARRLEGNCPPIPEKAPEKVYARGDVAVAKAALGGLAEMLNQKVKGKAVVR